MSVDTWLLYVATVLLLMVTPGPSHLLMLSVSMSNGFRRSLATAAGDLTANALQIILAGIGLATVITSSRHSLSIIKWAGVSYLVWIGAKQIRASFRNTNASTPAPAASLRTLWFRGFLTSASNPKAVVFFAALFPQFLDPKHPLATQILVLGATYIAIDGCFLATYGKGASWMAQKIRGHRRAWIERVAGSSLIAAAILLGLRANTRT